MKIVFDNIIYSLQQAGGISVVWTHLIKRVLEKWDGLSFIEYDGVHNIARKDITIPSDIIELRSRKFMNLKRYLNPKVSSSEPFIFHSSYFRTCSHPLAINITTVHDFTYEYFVKNPIKRWIHCKQKHQAIRKADMVVCISENTRNDLFKILPDIPHEKVHVIYNGVDDSFHQLDKHATEPYVLFVGKRDPYKNFDKIIEPISETGMELHIVGSPLNKNEKSLMQNFKCTYKYHGFVSNEELNTLYNHAFCLLYPSEYEGFGLPVLEAQKAGCPVIAFNGSSIKEIIGDNTLLLQTTTKDEIIKKMHILTDPTTRQQVISRGIENSRNYSWDRMTNSYISLYKEAMKV